MDREHILRITAEFSETSPTNYLAPPVGLAKECQEMTERLHAHNFARNNLYVQHADITVLDVGKSDKYVGMRFYLPPILAFGVADDPAYELLIDPAVVGPHHMLPRDWLPGAKTVITLFLPFTERVIQSNAEDPVEPSMEWLFARVDGQQHLLATAALVRDALIAEGYRAVVPQIDDRYVMRVSPAETHLGIPVFSSNWSERHVAFIAGLGTFGRSTNFISRRGTCGRLISFVTDWETEPDKHDYEEMYDYCAQCGACYEACPAGAYEGGAKNVARCSLFLQENCAKYAPRYGCGKCQAGMPCAVKGFGAASDKMRRCGVSEQGK